MKKNILSALILALLVQLSLVSFSFALANPKNLSAVEFYNKIDHSVFSEYQNASLNLKEYIQIKDLVKITDKIDNNTKDKYERVFKEYAAHNSKEWDNNKYVYVFISFKDEPKYTSSKYAIFDATTYQLMSSGKDWGLKE
ncbi:hypothetical protein J45TS6_36210 [Paenibacillus sp. J45TS6]|uniref:hypothetical protein n=1 Tax=unclassified Paenibacillus TaxID=185978 RepID=UPI001B0B31FA|nr:hypothetical protein [Paenibacillus sp. J45TS6]GIP45162.1 hypothetical protein J45TS6_36210 [Paenibacillus sp. J45TS6]